MHERANVGDMIRVQPPENVLRLEEAPRYLLIAGGVGITPILPIFRKLRRQAHPHFRLIYLTRSRELTAFMDELSAPDMAGMVTIHHSAPGGESPMDLWPFLAKPDDTHIYYCGPVPMMETIYRQTIHWPRRNIHFEDFAGVSALGPGSLPFKVRRAKTGEVIDIPADKTVVEVFREAGLKPKSSCESGTCGTCKVRLIAGEADHRDLHLSAHERSVFFMPCVSRAVGEVVLDI
jgi:phthalate 4,5-dioxygenase reductase subunit